MKFILLSLGLIISFSMMGVTNDTLIVSHNEYLVKAGLMGKRQVLIGMSTSAIVLRFSDRQLYTESRVFGTLGVFILTIMEYRKWQLIENAGKDLVVTKL